MSDSARVSTIFVAVSFLCVAEKSYMFSRIRNVLLQTSDFAVSMGVDGASCTPNLFSDLHKMFQGIQEPHLSQNQVFMYVSGTIVESVSRTFNRNCAASLVNQTICYHGSPDSIA
jgi:hypothetical protein